MSATKLDGPGTQKMQVLQDALMTLQQIHGLVERMALEIRNNKPSGVIPMQIKRAATPLVGQLKGQFGLIADQVSTLILIAGRGGGDQVKLRAYRESVGAIRQAIEMAQAKVKKEHAVAIDLAPE